MTARPMTEETIRVMRDFYARNPNALFSAEVLHLLSTSAAVRGMREALERIARPRDCGCVPCRGQCTSREALLIETEAMRDIADAALAVEAKEAVKESDSDRSSPLREAAIDLSDAVDRMWNDVHRFNPSAWESHAKVICAAQRELADAIEKAAKP